jgi:hypothetical protein
MALLFISADLFPQSERTLQGTLGYGYYETITLGLNMYLKPEHKFGISAGSSFMINNTMYYNIMIEDNIAIFKSKKNKLNNYKWFLTNKILYWDMEDAYYRWNVLSLSPAITRSFSVNSKVDLNIDFGPLFTIILESYRKTYEGFGWPYHYLPNLRILLNYKFKSK